MKKIRSKNKLVRLGIFGLIIGIMFSIVFNKSNNNIFFIIAILGAIGVVIGSIKDRRKKKTCPNNE